MVVDNAHATIANCDKNRVVNFGVLALFSFIRLETFNVKTIELVYHCHS